MTIQVIADTLEEAIGAMKSALLRYRNDLLSGPKLKLNAGKTAMLHPVIDGEVVPTEMYLDEGDVISTVSKIKVLGIDILPTDDVQGYQVMYNSRIERAKQSMLRAGVRWSGFSLPTTVVLIRALLLSQTYAAEAIVSSSLRETKMLDAISDCAFKASCALIRKSLSLAPSTSVRLLGLALNLAPGSDFLLKRIDKFLRTIDPEKESRSITFLQARDSLVESHRARPKKRGLKLDKVKDTRIGRSKAYKRAAIKQSKRPEWLSELLKNHVECGRTQLLTHLAPLTKDQARLIALTIAAQFQDEFHARYIKPEALDKPDLSEFRSEDYLGILLGDSCSICGKAWEERNVLGNRWHWLTCPSLPTKSGRPKSYKEVASLLSEVLWSQILDKDLSVKLKNLAIELEGYHRRWSSKVRLQEARRRTL